MVEPAHHRLSISTQCSLLRISRSSYYYASVPETDETLALMRSNCMSPSTARRANVATAMSGEHEPNSSASWVRRSAAWTGW